MKKKLFFIFSIKVLLYSFKAEDELLIIFLQVHLQNPNWHFDFV